MSADTFQARHDVAADAGRFGEASGWSRLGWVAEPGNLRWRGQLGFDLVQLAFTHKEARDWPRATRAARQARAALAIFPYPSGNESVDQLIGAAEALHREGCEQLGLPRPRAFRDGADVDVLGPWLSSLVAADIRHLDVVRIAGSAAG